MFGLELAGEPPALLALLCGKKNLRKMLTERD